MGINGLGLKFADIVKTSSFQRGALIANNLFESIATSVSYPLFGISTNDQTMQPINDVLVWNNIMMGQRHITAYNSSGTLPVYYNYWYMKNNIAWEYNIKTDLHADPAADGNRIGNWPVYHGVGYSGNVHSDSGTGDQFNNRFAGIRTSQTIWGTNTLYFDFVNYRASPATGVAGLGNGDYHIQAASPAKDIAVDWVLPYDLEGNVRGLPDSAGVYTTFVGTEPEPPASGGTINATTTTSPSVRIQ